MATKKTVKASEEPQEENQEVQADVVKAEVKTEEVVTKEIKVDPEEIVLENPVKEPVRSESDPKTFDDVYEVLEDISGKLDVIIRGL